MKEKKLTCIFEFQDGTNKSTDIECITDVIAGFWINKDREFTRNSDAAYWIPAARVFYVKIKD